MKSLLFIAIMSLSLGASSSFAMTKSTEDGAAASPKAGKQAFDVVPASQLEPLLRRLKLSETLITQFGRAYDYRAMTVPELQAILTQLQAGAAKQEQSRIDQREHEKQVIRTQSAETNEAPSAIEATHDSLGAEAPEAPAPPTL